MNDVGELLYALHRKGFRVWLENDRVRYQAPVGALGSAQIELLRDNKHEISNILHDVLEQAHDGTLLSPRLNEHSFPATLQQEHMSAILDSVRSCDRYMEYPLQITGPLDTVLLEASISEVIRNHESFRTRLVTVDGVLRQVISARSSHRFQAADLTSGAPEDVGKSALAGFMEQFFNRVPDVEKGPLLDIQLLRLSATRHILAVAVHHLISDELSMQIFFEELWAGYDLGARRAEVPNKPRVQYRDYAVWQRLTNRGWLRDHGPYWRKHLSGARPVIWPNQSKTPNTGIKTTSRHKIAFGRPLSSSLLDIARHEKVHPGIVALSMLAIEVLRWSNQGDFVALFTVSGRNRPEHEKMTGFLAYGLNLRFRLSGRETYSQLLRVTTQEMLEAWEHHDSERPIYKVLESNSGGEAFPLAFCCQWRNQKYVGTDERLQGKMSGERHIESLEVEKWTPDIPNMPMVWFFFCKDSEICGDVWYTESSFPRSMIEKFSAGVLTIAREMSVNCAAPIIPT